MLRLSQTKKEGKFMEKFLLILHDGMRPDAIEEIKHPFIEKLKKQSTYSLNAKTVYPSITLPCHLSLFYSVDPTRHGVLTNVFVPQVHPIDGLFDQLKKFEKKSAMFYSWEQLRDLNKPGSLIKSTLFDIHILENVNEKVTDCAIKSIKELDPDFAFIYLGESDEIGHKYGWMSKEYLDSIYSQWGLTEKIINNFSSDYNVIVTADHGGHGRMHGTTEKEDMTIPMFFLGNSFEKNKKLDSPSIMDIAPTILKVMDLPKPSDWDGKSII